MVWNARSHAAYQGYSHLSGIEMMCVIDHVEPFAVAHVPAVPLHRIGIVFHQPLLHIEDEVLFAPEHSSQRLAHHERFVFAPSVSGVMDAIELIRLPETRLEHFVKVLSEGRILARRIGVLQSVGGNIGEAQAHDLICSSADGNLVMRRRFCSLLTWIDGFSATVYDVVVDPVLHVRGGVR